MDFDPNEPRPGRFREEHYDPFRKSSPAMQSAAWILCILSFIFCWICYLSIPLGALAMILALLSRGGGRITRRVRSLVIAAAVSITLSAGLTGYAAYRVYTTPRLRLLLEQMIDQYLGQGQDPYLPGLSDQTGGDFA